MRFDVLQALFPEGNRGTPKVPPLRRQPRPRRPRRKRGDDPMRTLLTSALLLVVSLGSAWGADKSDFLTDEEADQLREAQEPSQRIEKYLSFAQIRLERFDDYRNRPRTPIMICPVILKPNLISTFASPMP